MIVNKLLIKNKASNDCVKITLNLKPYLYYIYLYIQTTYMEITFKGHKLELHYSMRIYIIYENITGSSLDSNDNSYTNLMALVYAALKSTLKYNKLDDNISLDDVIDFVDENDGAVFTARFTQWLEEQVNRQALAVRELDKVDEDKPESKKK